MIFQVFCQNLVSRWVPLIAVHKYLRNLARHFTYFLLQHYINITSEREIMGKRHKFRISYYSNQQEPTGTLVI